MEQIRNDKKLTGGSRPLFFIHILRKIFLEDWVMKLIALVITVALWLGVTGLSTPTTKRFTVPLNFGISNNTEITNSPIQEVDVVISGDKRKIEQINRAELAASIDLTDVAPGDRVLSLSPENVSVSLPLGIKLDEVQPSRIAVRIEAVEEKDVEIRAQLAGEPAQSFEVYDSAAAPSRVRVRGPASFIRTLESVATDPVDISGARDNIFARQVPVGVSNAKAAVLNTVVDITVRIGEKRAERRFTLTASGKKVSAVLFGPKTLLDAIKSDELDAEIIRSDSGEESARLILPDRLNGRIEIRSLKIGS